MPDPRVRTERVQGSGFRVQEGRERVKGEE
jgi:hypothetical protein